MRKFLALHLGWYSLHLIKIVTLGADSIIDLTNDGLAISRRFDRLTQLENSVPINQVKSIISIYFLETKCV
jgi:hypothetical protein